MIMAYRLPDGRVLIPRRAEAADGIIGDGYVVATPEEVEQWHAWTVAAPEEIVTWWRGVDGNTAQR